jgi:hypothetical protein
LAFSTILRPSAGELLPAGAAMALTAAGKQTRPLLMQTWLQRACRCLQQVSFCLLAQ